MLWTEYDDLIPNRVCLNRFNKITAGDRFAFNWIWNMGSNAHDSVMGCDALKAINNLTIERDYIP